ncbi:5-oxoprolinase subunit PxpB [Cohnella sp. AR92]|uniref:5-oxoprolinase subunit PxpB n=1 Tax=Cohnella sp. AR92 TaxID=648716 RepID=UPI000F8E12B8|nr:5-oxoprolinase subunit PxpB [Cohnella sp. AR92]RUS45488.1 5-oxoprolinase subunit PxpB [Cohnella sp. AR92]
MGSWSTMPLGEKAILLTLRDAASKAEGSGLPAAAAKRIAGAGLPWVTETVPAYESVAVYLNRKDLFGDVADDEAEFRFGQASSILAGLAEAERDEAVTSGREIRIPVVYGGEAGPDLVLAARRSGMTEAAFKDRHSSASYEVAMIGFTPGFPYLRGLPPELAQPRRDAPRLRVAAGSVGIAGTQTGIYPVASPGGWQLIGRTPTRLFRPESDEPFPILPGDRVRFVPIEEGDASWQEAKGAAAVVGAGRRNAGEDGAIEEARSAQEAFGEERPAMTVVRPGLQTTVQDLGRTGGWQAFGVSVGGAMDADRLRAANWLVGNADNAAGLELTLSGGEYRIEKELLVALTGADFGAEIDGEPFPLDRPVLLRRGAVVRFRGAASGCRAYLAVAGGVEAWPTLGSRSTDLRAGIGGIEGRALAAGDRLRTGEPSLAARRLIERLRRSGQPEDNWSAGKEYLAAGTRAGASGSVGESRSFTLRVLEGSGWSRFTEKSRRDFFRGGYRIEPNSDRMGLRLSGEPLKLARQEELLSHGVCPGAIQVPASGQPIVLGQGCQPTGGYPIIAHVAAADLGVLAQLRPGDEASFEAVSLGEALQASREQEIRLSRLKQGIRLKWFL